VVCYGRGLTLCNDSAAVLGCRLTTPPPFSVLVMDPGHQRASQPQSRCRLNRTERRLLEARQNVAVSVAFALSPDLLRYVHSLQFLHGL